MRFPSLSVSIESQLMRLLMLRLFIERFAVMLTEPLILNHPWGRFSIDCPYLNLIKSERERLPPMYKLPDFETFIFKNGRYIILKSSLKLLLNYYFFWRI